MIPGNTKRKKRLRRFFISIAFLLLLIVLAVLFQSREKLFATDSRTAEGDSTNADDLQKKVQEQADESMFTARINSRILFKNEEEEVLLYIRSPDENKYDTYVELIPDSTGKSIYTSEILKPGEGIEKDIIKSPPTMGVNPCTARFHILEGNEEISVIEYEISIEAQKG